MLAQAVGPALTKYMHELLEQMFAGGLSEPLRQALVDLSIYIPPLLPTIQGKPTGFRKHVLLTSHAYDAFIEKLLNLLSLILCGQPYRHPGSPQRHAQSLTGNIREYQVLATSHSLRISFSHIILIVARYRAPGC